MKPVFLSYSRKNLKGIQEIATVLCAGGIKIWQDVQSLATGNTDEQIRTAIWEECGAFIIYLTEESIASEFIREIEIREAFKRSDKDKDFHIVPIVAMPLDDANTKLQGVIRGDISRYNGVILEKGDPLFDAARKIRNVLLKTLIGKPKDQGFTISLMTYSRTASSIQPQLDLDWSRISFPEKLTSNNTWATYLLPALLDVKGALLNTGITDVKLFTKATLSAGFAYGYVFRRETGVTLHIEQAGQFWSTRGRPQKASGIKISSLSRNIGSRHLGVNLSITTSIDNNMGEYLSASGLSLRAELRCQPECGPARDSVAGGESATAIAWEIGNSIRQARAEYNITDVHIFAAMPLGLAFMIGSELNACGRIHLYEFDKSESRYLPSWILDGSY